MGIRPKILLAFILCFGLAAGVSLNLLRRSMNESYAAIERRDLIAHMGRVLHGMEAGMAGLSSQTRDWAEWTDMYDFALNPHGRAKWAQENLAAQSLESADLSLVMVFGPKWQLLTTIEPKQPGPKIVFSAQQVQAYRALFKEKQVGPRCGVVVTDAGLLTLCWARIARSDFSGEFAGAVLMGRLLSPARLSKLREQTGLPFDLIPVSDMPRDLVPWPNTLSAGRLGGTGFWTSHDTEAYHLYYPVQDVLRRDVGLISLQVPRDVHSQGLLLYGQVRLQLLWTAVAMAVLLGLALHGLLVSRLRRLTGQLLELGRQSSWHTRIDVKGRDELGLLAREVNTMLGLIESQVADLTALSMTDTLTGLPNRRAFDARLALEHPREQRHDRALALLILDVDHFKPYNDRYGHPAGDAALKALAAVLRLACGRASDLAARTGGEEFAVLLPETDAKGALEIAGRIQQLLRERKIRHEASPVAPCVTVSIGIAVAGEETRDAFVQRADRALYMAKHGGRNRVHCDGAPVSANMTGAQGRPGYSGTP